MRAKKIQTTCGRKIFEKGFIPKHAQPLDDHVAVPSTWLGFEHATQLMIIYIPEN